MMRKLGHKSKNGSVELYRDVYMLIRDQFSAQLLLDQYPTRRVRFENGQFRSLSI